MEVDSESLQPTQLLKVAHHGSITSSSASFLDRFNPVWRLFPARNRARNFPHASVVRRFKARGVALFQTPCGAYAFGPNLRLARGVILGPRKACSASRET